jgi:hypothetical protein
VPGYKGGHFLELWGISEIGYADGEYCWLGINGLAKNLLRSLKAKLGEWETQNRISLLEDCLSLRRGGIKFLCHAYPLGTLPREDISHFSSPSHKEPLRILYMLRLSFVSLLIKVFSKANPKKMLKVQEFLRVHGFFLLLTLIISLPS